MFEKLKEYSIYIIISLVWLWLLVLMYLDFGAWKEWENFINSIRIWIKEWNELPQSLKDNTTIVELIQKSWISKLWNYQIKKDNIILFNWNWDAFVNHWVDNIIVFDEQWSPTITTDQKIFQIYLLPHRKIEWVIDSNSIPWTIKWYLLEKKKMLWWIYKENNELISVQESARWFLTSWYIWIWNFWSLQLAEQIQERYLPKWTIVKLNTDQYWIFVEFNA